MKFEYGYFYPLIVELAEVALSAPITNSWPERGASAVKRITTRLRKRLKNDMLNSYYMCQSMAQLFQRQRQKK